MMIPKKRCRHCGGWFNPYPPKRGIQTYCSRRACQRERHRQACRAFYRDDPHCDDRRRAKIRDWARKRGYWRWYRQTHPGYRARDNTRRRLSRQGVDRAAKRDAWQEMAVEKLRDIQGQGPDFAAKRDAWDPRMEQVLAYLVWKEMPQNETVPQGPTI
jgi:hypothetical protein